MRALPLFTLLSALAFPGATSAQQTSGLGPLTPAQLSQDQRLLLMLDEVVAVVGDEVITRMDLQDWLRTGSYWPGRLQEAQRLPEKQALEELDAIQLEALAEITERLLRTRAGQDRGFDPALVKTLVEREFKRRQEDQGGPREMRAWLERYGLDPESFRESIRRDLYERAWEDSITGRGAGPTGRLDMDTYVRPGLLYSTYLELAASPLPEERAIVGAEEASVRLSEIGLPVQSYGGLQPTLVQASDLRRLVMEEDAEFDELARTWNTDRSPKISSPTLSHVALASRGLFKSEDLIEFAQNAKPGDVCQPLSSTAGSVHLFQLIERLPAKKPRPFGELEIQNLVRDHIEKERRRVRLGRAMEKLLRTVQVQPQELARFMSRPTWIYRDRSGR